MSGTDADISPLANTILNNNDIHPQSGSRLFSMFPREIRDSIYALALTSYDDYSRPYHEEATYCCPGSNARQRVAYERIMTCRKIYMEAHLIPFTVNPLQAVHAFDKDVPPGLRSPNKAALKMKPWQCKAVRSLDLTMQQFALDNGRLKLYAKLFSPTSADTDGNRTDYHIRDVPGRRPYTGFASRTRLEKLKIKIPRDMWWTWAAVPTSLQ